MPSGVELVRVAQNEGEDVLEEEGGEVVLAEVRLCLRRRGSVSNPIGLKDHSDRISPCYQ